MLPTPNPKNACEKPMQKSSRVDITRVAIKTPRIAFFPHFYYALLAHGFPTPSETLPCTYVARSSHAASAIQVVFEVSSSFWRGFASVAGTEIGYGLRLCIGV
jgi:hypothetical protein